MTATHPPHSLFFYISEFQKVTFSVDGQSERKCTHILFQSPLRDSSLLQSYYAWEHASCGRVYMYTKVWLKKNHRQTVTVEGVAFTKSSKVFSECTEWRTNDLEHYKVKDTRYAFYPYPCVSNFSQFRSTINHLQVIFAIFHFPVGHNFNPFSFLFLNFKFQDSKK